MSFSLLLRIFMKFRYWSTWKCLVAMWNSQLSHRNSRFFEATAQFLRDYSEPQMNHNSHQIYALYMYVIHQMKARPECFMIIHILLRFNKNDGDFVQITLIKVSLYSSFECYWTFVAKYYQVDQYLNFMKVLDSNAKLTA